MRDHLCPVRLFGRDYYWHQERGGPLQLLPAVPPPESPEVRPEDLYSELVRLYARPLPRWGELIPHREDDPSCLCGCQEWHQPGRDMTTPRPL